jgi:hypothetical protein
MSLLGAVERLLRKASEAKAPIWIAQSPLRRAGVRGRLALRIGEPGFSSVSRGRSIPSVFSGSG